jgi:Ca2+/Na+ antiporter
MTKKSAQDPDRRNSPIPRRKRRPKSRGPRLTLAELVGLLLTITGLLQALTDAFEALATVLGR